MMGAYFRLQVSKPQSIAWMGAGNPVGQAAWIAERFHDWSDLSAKGFEEVYPLDRMLTNIMIYVMTGSFTTGAWYYRALLEEGRVFLGEMSCNTKGTLVEVAVRTLIKEIVATYETRRGVRRRPCQCEASKARPAEVTP